MDDTTHVTLDEPAQDEFLGTGGTGVLSLSGDPDQPPHSVPVSYGYDQVERVFYFRIAVGPDSEKPSLTDRAVTFVTYRELDDGYRSVVAQGHLEAVDDEAIATETLAGLDRVDLALFDVFERSIREVDFEFYRLDPQRQTGRVENPTD